MAKKSKSQAEIDKQVTAELEQAILLKLGEEMEAEAVYVEKRKSASEARANLREIQDEIRALMRQKDGPLPLLENQEVTDMADEDDYEEETEEDGEDEDAIFED